jgi:hypothetical protein
MMTVCPEELASPMGMGKIQAVRKAMFELASQDSPRWLLLGRYWWQAQVVNGQWWIRAKNRSYFRFTPVER